MKCSFCKFETDSFNAWFDHCNFKKCYCGKTLICKPDIIACTEKLGDYDCKNFLCDNYCIERHLFLFHHKDIKCKFCDEYHFTIEHALHPNDRRNTNYKSNPSLEKNTTKENLCNLKKTKEHLCDLCGFESDNYKEWYYHSDPCACGDTFDCNPTVIACSEKWDDNKPCSSFFCNTNCEEWHRYRYHFKDIQCKFCDEYHFTKDHDGPPNIRIKTNYKSK